MDFEGLLGLIGLIFLLLFILWVWVILCLLIAGMAKKRGRSPLFWFIVSFLFTPLWGVIGVLIMGQKEQ